MGAILLYSGMVLYSDASNVAKSVSGIDLAWIPAILALPLFNYFLRFLKWQYFLSRMGVSIPVRTSLWAFLAGFSMTVSPGKFGELLKCYLLKERRSIPVSVTSPVVVAERITDLLSMIVIAVVAALVLGGTTGLLAALAGALFAGLVMSAVLCTGFFEWLTGLLCRLSFFGKRKDGICAFRENCARLLDLRSLAVSVPLGILSWGVEAMVLCAVAAALGYSLSAWLALLAHSAGTIVGAVSMIPGGLGLTEITIDGIISEALPVSAATATTLLMRFATLWFAVLLGLAALGLRRRKT
ncbi:flippase-like domain-containing protein [Candidatus Fermentibacteria bacterium]|nr:flippase-like domain-containing protein [Candidatus Fermentibacteria bacterium]